MAALLWLLAEQTTLLTLFSISFLFCFTVSFHAPCPNALLRLYTKTKENKPWDDSCIIPVSSLRQVDMMEASFSV